MSEMPQEPLPRQRRKKWVLDPAAQLGAVFTVVGIGATFLLFGVVARFWNMHDGSSGLDSDQASRLALVADILFVTFALVAVGVYVVWLTHRFVGPARVIHSALEGMAKGKFGRRLSLRKRDFLKEVAAAASDVAQTMSADRDAVARLVETVGSALEKNDTAAARAAIAAFRQREAAPRPPAAVVAAD